jgi:tetratricopeptide (TPR) repeat protein
MSTRDLVAGVSAAALACAAAGIALASGGGGGGGGGGFGGGSMPSASAPRYNPVDEYRKGIAALQAGDFRGADKDFDHVLEVAPKEPNTLYAMGMAKAGEKNFKDAARFYDRTLKLDAQNINARRELAITEVQLGQLDKAKADLAALQTRASACADACSDAAQLRASLAAVEAAVAPPAPAPGAPPTPATPGAPGPGASLERPNLLFASTQAGDHDYVAAVHLINEHRYAEALEQLRAAEAAFGPHPDILTYIGYVSRKLGRLDEAEAYYRQALAIYPDHVGATEYYGELKVIRGDLAGARQMLAKLERTCAFGCVEADDLRRWIDAGHEPS